jgi:hypothetical protein
MMSGTLAAEGSRSGMIQLTDKSGRMCGTPLIMGREAQLIENTRLLAPQLPASLAKESQTAHEVGDTLSFYTIDFTSSSYASIRAVCMKKTSQTYIFVGVNDLDADRVDIEDIDGFYTAFELATPPASLDPDKGIYALVTSIFGNPPNRFSEEIVYILIHDIKDSYNPDAGKNVYIAGYFSPTDQTTGAYSNRKNLINVDCYPQDPTGAGALATVAHEFQHLIHNGQDADEDNNGLWVNEGASEYSEVLCGYGLRMPTYYLQHPERSLIEFNAADENLWDYQKVALWTYYLAEKFGAELIGEIVKDPKNSIEGVRSALLKRGITLSFEDIFANFAIANYADDPALGENGYFAYNKIYLPSLPASTPHAVYPLNDQSKSLPMYSMGYYRFTGEDSTATLHIQGKPGFELRARVYEPGQTGTVQSIALDATNAGSYSLQNVGRSADAAVLAAISLGNYNSFTYAVSSELTDNTPPFILAGPQEVVPTGRSISIAWQTDELSTSYVEYGLSAAYGSSLSDPTLVTEHVITLTNLTPNTLYHYRIGSTDAYGNGPRYSADFQFMTASTTDHLVAKVTQSHSFAYSGRNLASTPDGALHLLYHNVLESQRFIYHKSSLDGGVTWSAAVLVGESLYHSGMPSLAVDGLGRLHAAWHARPGSAADLLGIYYSRSDDNGASWSAPVRLSSADEEHDMLYASIAVDPDNNPHVVWNVALYDDDYAGEIFYTHSSDGGRSWAGDRVISASIAQRCHVPVIEISPAGEAWVIWTDGLFEQAARNVWCTHSTNYTNWSTPVSVSSSGVLYDRYPAMVIDDQSTVHLAYADNYTPGDIRIMYTAWRAGSWSTAVPVAQSATGNVSSPSLTSDAFGNLALLYRDDQGSASLGRNISAPDLAADAPVLARTTAADGDIFLSICRQGEWISGGNISNDDVDDLYPETSRRIQDGGIDALWMRVNSTSDNEIHHLRLATQAAGSSEPLHVSAIYPAADAADVSYFKQNFYVQVEFDQRVISDSITAATFSVTSAAEGALVGLITYDASLRRLRFEVESNLLPDDLITVRLKGSIPQSAGIGLDGNGNGIAEGSPADDYLWSFRTAGADLVSPALTIGIAQNPVLTRYMDVYVFASELLRTSPDVEIAGTSVPAQRVPGETPIYKADYKLEQNGILPIKVSGEDLAGNKGEAVRQFSAQFMLTESGGWLSSPDGRLSLTVGVKGLPLDLYLTVVPEVAADPAADPVWTIGPAETNLSQAARLRIAVPVSGEKGHRIERRRPDGSWEALDGAEENGAIEAEVMALGAFRVTATGQIIPRQFALQQNYPNPFRLGLEKTTFLLELPQRQEVEVGIYNLLGERIMTLTKSTLPAGIHALAWDGRDSNRMRVASGVYFYRCVTAGNTFTRKMLILQ